jgi:molybdopterin-guanine dinucleotide biosynthesis protein A
MTFCAALIAGGKSSRMGRDKRMLEVEGKPLWRRQLDLLASLEPAELVISGPLDGPWLGTSCRVIPDRHPNRGPLGGLVSVLEATKSPFVLTLAVDMPRMSRDLLSRLWSRCVPGRGIVPEMSGQLEPLAACYPAACLPTLRHALASDRLGLWGLVRDLARAGLVQVENVSVADAPLFQNLNTAADLEGL